MVTPAPATVTRRATSCWSRPCGMQTRGTPATSAFVTVPCPACVTATAACGRTAPCEADRTTRTDAGAGTVAGSIAGPVVTSPRTGSRPSAAATRRRTAR